MSTPYTGPQRVVSLEERRSIVAALLSPLSPSWEADGSWGYVTCPGADCHNNGNGRRDCRVYVDERPGTRSQVMPPGLYCVHTSCAGVLAACNQRIRSEIGKAKVRDANGKWLGATGSSGGGNGIGRTAGQPGAKSSGAAQPTARTGVYNVPPRGAEAQPTARTGVSKPLVRFARTRTHTQSGQEGSSVPSAPSAVAQLAAQPGPEVAKMPPVVAEKAVEVAPVVAPVPHKKAESGKNEAVPKKEGPGGDVLVWMKGYRPVKGRWVGDVWVTEKIL